MARKTHKKIGNLTACGKHVKWFDSRRLCTRWIQTSCHNCLRYKSGYNGS